MRTAQVLEAGQTKRELRAQHPEIDLSALDRCNRVTLLAGHEPSVVKVLVSYRDVVLLDPTKPLSVLLDGAENLAANQALESSVTNPYTYTRILENFWVTGIECPDPELRFRDGAYFSLDRVRTNVGTAGDWNDPLIDLVTFHQTGEAPTEATFGSNLSRVLVLTLHDIRWFWQNQRGPNWRPRNAPIGVKHHVPVGIRNLISETPFRDASENPPETYTDQHAASPGFSSDVQARIDHDRRQAAWRGGVLEPTEQTASRPLSRPFLRTEEGRRPLDWTETLWTLLVDLGAAWDTRTASEDPEVWVSWLDLSRFRSPPLPSHPHLEEDTPLWEGFCRILYETGHTLTPLDNGSLRVVPVTPLTDAEAGTTLTALPDDGTDLERQLIRWAERNHHKFEWGRSPIQFPSTTLPRYIAVRHRAHAGWGAYRAAQASPQGESPLPHAVFSTEKLLKGTNLEFLPIGLSQQFGPSLYTAPTRDLTGPGLTVDCHSLCWDGYLDPSSGTWIGDNDSITPLTLSWKATSGSSAVNFKYDSLNYEDPENTDPEELTIVSFTPSDFFAPASYLVSLAEAPPARVPQAPPYLYPLARVAQQALLRLLWPEEKFRISGYTTALPSAKHPKVVLSAETITTTIWGRAPEPPPAAPLSSQKSEAGGPLLIQLVETLSKGKTDYVPVRVLHLSTTEPSSYTPEDNRLDDSLWTSDPDAQQYPEVPSTVQSIPPRDESPPDLPSSLNPPGKQDGGNRPAFADKWGLEQRPAEATGEQAPAHPANAWDLEGDDEPTGGNDRPFFRVYNATILLANASGRPAHAGEIHRVEMDEGGAYVLVPSSSTILGLAEATEAASESTESYEAILVEEYRSNRVHAAAAIGTATAQSYLDALEASGTLPTDFAPPLERITVLNAQAEAVTAGDRKLVALAGQLPPWRGEGETPTAPLADSGDLDGKSVWRTVPAGSAGTGGTGTIRKCGNVIAVLRNCSDVTIYPGQMLLISRPDDSRYDRSRPLEEYFQVPTRTVTDTENEPPLFDPVDVQRHMVETDLSLPVKDALSSTQACPALIGELAPYEEPIFLEISPETVQEAYERITSKLARFPAIASSTVAPGATGDFVVGGLAEVFGDLEDVTDDHLEPFLGKRIAAVADTTQPVRDRVGILKHFDAGDGFSGEDQVDIDGIGYFPSRYYAPLPQMPVSTKRGPIRILHASRRDLPQEQPTVPVTSVTLEGSEVRRFTNEREGRIPVPKGVGGNTLVLIVQGEEEDLGASAQDSVDIEWHERYGWKTILEENTKVTAADKTYWLHRAVFVRGLPNRRTDPFYAYFDERTSETLNRHAALMEFRGADPNTVTAVDQTKSYINPDTGTRLAAPGDVGTNYTIAQATHVYEQP